MSFGDDTSLMSRVTKRWLAALILTAMIFHPGAASARTGSTRSVWVEAFQSSPADYQFARPESLRGLTRAILTPLEVTGTIRVRLASAVAGKRIMLRISNEAREEPLTIARVTIGFAEAGLVARDGSLKAVTFSGNEAFTIAGRAPALSDALDFPVRAGDELVISVAVAGKLAMNRAGGNGMGVAPGDQSMSPRMSDAVVMSGRPLISGVLVEAARPVSVIVALGDSITDGNQKVGMLRGWPEQLNRRLVALRRSERMAVVNAGISGNRVLSHGFGTSALARLDRDVLRLSGVTHLIVLEGINDIGLAGDNPLVGGQPELNEQDLVAGYRQIVARAHAAGVKVILGTIMPFAGATYYSEHKERQRQYVNAWIRSSREVDGVIDFDKAMRDPTNPLMLLPAYDSGDHLHPSEAGKKHMGDLIDITLFE